jgi:hypothetical protein
LSPDKLSAPVRPEIKSRELRLAGFFLPCRPNSCRLNSCQAKPPRLARRHLRAANLIAREKEQEADHGQL